MENMKMSDAFKDIRSALDNGTNEADLPDALLARALKLKLLSLKMEGMEAKTMAELNENVK